MKKTRQRKDDTSELQIEFSNIMGIFVELNPLIYKEEDISRVYDIIGVLQREISIDKSYVDYSGTKYEKTFMTEDGWNSLCKIVKDSDYGKNMADDVRDTLNDAFKGMILCYIEQIFEDLGYNTDGIKFSTKSDFSCDVKYLKDTACAWKRYPGKWQTWD